MSATYWAQWSHEELNSMHGNEWLDDDEEESIEVEEYVDQCPYCSGHGCNDCLMVSY